MPPENGDLLLADRAITSEDDDEFGHKEYADSLGRILQNANPPWHIGIFGEWGAGKTSIIRMLFNRLRTERKFEDTVFVEFDAWSHAEGSIRTELLLELDKKIGKEIKGDSSDGVLGEDDITGRLYDVQEEEQVSKPANPRDLSKFLGRKPGTRDQFHRYRWGGSSIRVWGLLSIGVSGGNGVTASDPGIHPPAIGHGSPDNSTEVPSSAKGMVGVVSTHLRRHN